MAVSAVEIQKDDEFVTERRLLDLGLPNYWGYMTLGFLAPHAPYRSGDAAGSQVAGFKAMVEALHAAGLEVILDVVPNHTCEGGAGGPALAFRGLATRRCADAPFLRGDGDGDATSLDARDAPMSDERWSDPANHFIALLPAGDRADEPDADVLLVLDVEDAEHALVAPGAAGRRFELLLDAGGADGIPPVGAGVDAGATPTLAPRTVLVAAAPR